MKVEKKEGLKHIKIHHNKTVFWIIVVLFVILLVIIFSIKQIGNNQTSQTSGRECTSDSDCVSSACCHASSCVPSNQSPKCEGAMCTMDCRPNTTDCGQGSCACIENKCSVKWSK